MSMQMIATQHKQVAADVVDPVAQASVDALTVLAGSALDARLFGALSYTIAIITNAVKWTVYAGNVSDFSDEQVVNSEAIVGAAASSSYAVTPPPYSYYRVKIRASVGGAQGTATLHGIAK